MSRIKIISLTNGERTPFDGQFVKAYDPNRVGYDPKGNPMICYLVTTRDPDEALQLTAAEALALWNKASGIRPDGKPSRPLTAFSVEIK
jgi:hypothetical protein